MSSCLPISTISMSFVGFESRSTMLPASLAAWVPVFIATPTSAWASAGASFVPSPVIATSRPAACSRLISAILSSGVASARKSSTPASSAIAFAVSGLSPVIITVRMPIRRISSKRSRMPCLTTSLRWTTPSARPRSATTRGVPRRRRSRRRSPPPRPGRSRPSPRPSGGRRRPRPCARTAVEVDAAHPRLRRERTNVAPCRSARASRIAPSRGRRSSGLRVSSGRLESWAASASCSGVTPGAGTSRSPDGCRG